MTDDLEPTDVDLPVPDSKGAPPTDDGADDAVEEQD